MIKKPATVMMMFTMWFSGGLTPFCTAVRDGFKEVSASDVVDLMDLNSAGSIIGMGAAHSTRYTRQDCNYSAL